MNERTAVKLLIVEDNPADAKLLRLAFGDPRWTVDIAETGANALRLVDRKYDAVLVDYHLPDMSGLEVLDRFRAKDPAPAFVFVTGQGSEEVAMLALSRGALDYVTKGLDYHERIVAVVEEAMDKRTDALSVGEDVPSPDALKSALAHVRLTSPVRGYLVMSAGGRALGGQLPGEVDPAALATSLAGMRSSFRALAAQLKAEARYVHLRLDNLGLVLEPIGQVGLLATVIEPPDAVLSARARTRDIIAELTLAWEKSG
ncbi:MAG TPA: response regulator [Candidatus Thermoplasmatota archaeon]|nr:response regulator [Candidatus Thermoplasmatota archaeon]